MCNPLNSQYEDYLALFINCCEKNDCNGSESLNREFLSLKYLFYYILYLYFF
jgi:hypothetical protein